MSNSCRHRLRPCFIYFRGSRPTEKSTDPPRSGTPLPSSRPTLYDTVVSERRNVEVVKSPVFSRGPNMRVSTTIEIRGDEEVNIFTSPTRPFRAFRNGRVCKILTYLILCRKRGLRLCGEFAFICSTRW